MIIIILKILKTKQTHINKQPIIHETLNIITNRKWITEKNSERKKCVTWKKNIKIELYDQLMRALTY